MERGPTLASAEATFLEPEVGCHAISVWAVADLSAHDIVRLARSHDSDSEKHLPHSQIRTSTVGQLRACGFGFLPDSPDGHYLLTLPTPPSEDDWAALDGAFTAAEPSPPR
jgi:hypothetical protein